MRKSVQWLLERNCDDSDDVKRIMGVQERLVRAKTFFETRQHPTWERPPQKPRYFAKQEKKPSPTNIALVRFSLRDHADP